MERTPNLVNIQRDLRVKFYSRVSYCFMLSANQVPCNCHSMHVLFQVGLQREVTPQPELKTGNETDNPEEDDPMNGIVYFDQTSNFHSFLLRY